MNMENGLMKMRPVEGGLEIKPGETVTLKPGGDHMMFVKLKHPLQIGNAIEVTLQFEKAGAVKIEMPVVAIGAAAPGVSTGGGTMMMQDGSKMHSGH
jgi:copper(I)-binding protein